jgi:putative endonuclease
MFYVYIIYSLKLDKFYIGYTSNIQMRMHEYHNRGRNKITDFGSIKIII